MLSIFIASISASIPYPHNAHTYCIFPRVGGLKLLMIKTRNNQRNITESTHTQFRLFWLFLEYNNLFQSLLNVAKMFIGNNHQRPQPRSHPSRNDNSFHDLMMMLVNRNLEFITPLFEIFEHIFRFYPIKLRIYIY